jgi:hypothetical protein
MFTNPATRQWLERGDVGEWVDGYVWVVLPYVVLGILSAALRKRQFISWWILGCAVITALTSLALYDLVFEKANEEVGMAIGIGPLLTWMQLGVLLAVGVIVWVVVFVVVRVVQAARQRPK